MSLPPVTDGTRPAIAVFSVCAGPELNAIAASVCDAIPGASFEGGFNEYLTDGRKPQLTERMRQAGLCVALVDCDADTEAALQTIESLHNAGFAKLEVVAFGAKIELTQSLQLMRSGCREFLIRPVEREPLQQCIARFREQQHLADVSPQYQARVITMAGGKGGVGTTTLLVHLACTLAVRHKKRVLVLDTKRELGHVGLYLGLPPGQYCFDDLLRSSNTLDADLLSGLVTRHSTGVDVLVSPDSEKAVSGREQHLEAAVLFLRSRYDVVLADVDLADKDFATAALCATDDFFFVTTPELAALRDLGKRVDIAAEAGAARRIIVNRHREDGSVPLEAIRQSFGERLMLVLPESPKALSQALNLGQIVPPNDKSAFAKQIRRWAELLLLTEIAPEQPQRKKSWFSMFGKSSRPATGAAPCR